MNRAGIAGTPPLGGVPIPAGGLYGVSVRATMKMLVRPRLQLFPLYEAVAALLGQRGATIVVTMAEGRWEVLRACMKKVESCWNSTTTKCL